MSGTIGVSADNSGTEEKKPDTEVNLLNSDEFRALEAMGLVDKEAALMAADSKITRAQFAGYLFKLSGFALIEYRNKDIPFIDVNSNTPYFNEICTMYGMGMLSGTGENTFSPKIYCCKIRRDCFGVCGDSKGIEVK